VIKQERCCHRAICDARRLPAPGQERPVAWTVKKLNLIAE
jgi:hypothetical protein